VTELLKLSEEAIPEKLTLDEAFRAHPHDGPGRFDEPCAGQSAPRAARRGVGLLAPSS